MQKLPGRELRPQALPPPAEPSHVRGCRAAVRPFSDMNHRFARHRPPRTRVRSSLAGKPQPYDAIVTIRFVNCARAISTHRPFLKVRYVTRN